MEIVPNILSFFRDIESMEIPSAPRLQRHPMPVIEFLSDRPRQMPWQTRTLGLTQKDATFHLVCLGVTNMRPLVERVLEAIAPDAEIDEELMARQRGQGFLGTLLLDWRGRPIKDNLFPAPFVYGVDRLAEGKSLSGLEAEITEKTTQIADQFFGDSILAVDEAAVPHQAVAGAKAKLPNFDFEVHLTQMNHALLDRLSRGLASKLGIDPDSVNFRVMTRVVRRYKRRDLSPPDFSEVVTPSFYVADLAAAGRTIKKQGLSVPLETFLGNITDPEERVNLLEDADAMAKCVSPEKLCSGRWPSNPDHPLCLAQQAAVGMAIGKGEQLLAVNGPPGTGKTTLLRDVIAQSVVERAVRLYHLEDPMDAFVETHTSESSFPVIRPELVEGTGILVTSNNNAAVENISAELPRRSEIDMHAFEKADYLSDVANDVARSFGEKDADCWGLMALKMGNKSNVEYSLRGLDQPYRDGDKSIPANGLFERLNGTAHFGDWMSAKSAFRLKVKNLETALDCRISKAIDLGHITPEVADDLDPDESEVDPDGKTADVLDGGLEYNMPDAGFFEQSFERQHLSSAWTDREIDKLRSEVFLAALRLHDVILRLNAAELRRLIYPMKRALTGQEKLTSLQMVKVWNTLFFISPVVSTTLASVRKLPMVRGWLGHVLIDEAGQATPQSVVGVLQRALKATIVGDPLQIEPVFTVPTPVVDKLREGYGVDERFSPSIASAQTVADATMMMGAWVRSGGEESGKVWTGMPLRVHRRCAEPMFSIANRIAYDGQMVQAAEKDPIFDHDPGSSAWFDVAAVSAQNKVVPEEMATLQREIESIKAAWPVRADGEKASIFVISPFVSVAAEADQVVRKVLGRDAWKLCPTGTVHRFQGREADIVYLVLGSNPGQKGEGSRKWAALRPNLLNVALTRAKARIYVIGDFNSWSQQPYFSKLAQTMQMREAVFKVKA